MYRNEPCISQEIKKTTSFTKIRLDPRSSAIQNYRASEIFKSVEYIPLETNSHSVFGSVDQLEITNDLILVLDRSISIINLESRSAIIAFHKDGRFKFKIEGYKINCFSVDTDLKLISFMSDYTGEQIYYSFTGKLIKKGAPAISAVDWLSLPNETIYYRGYNAGDELIIKNIDQKNRNIYVLNKNNELKKAFLEFKPGSIRPDEIISSRKFFFTSSEGTYFLEPFKFAAYLVSGDTLTKDLEFIFPADRMLPADFTYNEQFLNKRLDYLTDRKNIFFLMNNLYRNNGILSFQLSNFNTPYQGYLYSLKSQRMIMLKSIMADSVFTSFPTLKKIDSSFKEHYYAVVEPQKLKTETYESLIKNGLNYQPQNKANPLIVKLQITNNL